ncbi:MAG: hypothetical protein JWQ03_479, partial [Variovorax sp.]|nr:hypothetical protein [Variovorax sp.]
MAPGALYPIELGQAMPNAYSE